MPGASERGAELRAAAMVPQDGGAGFRPKAEVLAYAAYVETLRPLVRP